MTTEADRFGYPTEARGSIPSFSSREEEAAFWDTHDFTDFIDEADRVTLTIGGELGERMTVRLDHADRIALTRIARRKGVGPSTLARMWLKERLSVEADRAGDRKAS